MDAVHLEADAGLADRRQVLEADASQRDDGLLAHLSDVQRRRVQRQRVHVGDAEGIELRLVERGDRLGLGLGARLEHLADHHDLLDALQR